MSIEITGVSKSFGPVAALKDVSLSIAEGKIYGLLGRNGAGKSTLLNIITNRLFADSGTVLIDGEPAAENDRALGKVYLMSEKHLYPEGMKVANVLKWSRHFYPDFDMDFALTLAEKFGLNLNKKVKALSTGYSSILKIIVSLSVNVPYVLLDEPVLGLDANHRDMFYKILVERYSLRPATYVISTHLIEEVAGIIEDVIIIKEGEIIRQESCEGLIAQGYTVSGNRTVVDQFIADKNVIGSDDLGGLKSAYILGTLDRSAVPAGLEITRLDLQKLFIQLTA